MLCIVDKSTDPYRNLAAEEYLLTAFRDEGSEKRGADTDGLQQVLALSKHVIFLLIN